jgi:hypothetical protein
MFAVFGLIQTVACESFLPRGRPRPVRGCRNRCAPSSGRGQALGEDASVGEGNRAAVGRLQNGDGDGTAESKREGMFARLRNCIRARAPTPHYPARVPFGTVSSGTARTGPDSIRKPDVEHHALRDIACHPLGFEIDNEERLTADAISCGLPPLRPHSRTG